MIFLTLLVYSITCIHDCNVTATPDDAGNLYTLTKLLKMANYVEILVAFLRTRALYESK